MAEKSVEMKKYRPSRRCRSERSRRSGPLRPGDLGQEKERNAGRRRKAAEGIGKKVRPTEDHRTLQSNQHISEGVQESAEDGGGNLCSGASDTRTISRSFQIQQLRSFCSPFFFLLADSICHFSRWGCSHFEGERRIIPSRARGMRYLANEKDLKEIGNRDWSNTVRLHNRRRRAAVVFLSGLFASEARRAVRP